MIEEICEFKKNVSMKTLSTIKIGGRADYVAYPKNQKQITELIQYCKSNNIKFFILGNGSNVLCCDRRYYGVIIKLSHLNKVFYDGKRIYAEAGAFLCQLINCAIDNSICGFENLSGIPATIGGALKMNAGAFGSCISDMVIGVNVLRENKVIYLPKEECAFKYRKSGFLKDDIIISAIFNDEKSNKGELVSRQKEVLLKRSLIPKEPSLGSIFKRHEKVIVSKLIDELNLKGVQCGGAMVSPIHAGFIVNFNNAKAKDVKRLINYIKRKCVKERGILLEEEIVYLD